MVVDVDDVQDEQEEDDQVIDLLNDNSVTPIKQILPGMQAVKETTEQNVKIVSNQ